MLISRDTLPRCCSPTPTLRYVFATYHPPGLPNEMPGKASNTRWAAQRLWAFIEAREIDPDCVVLTISDADSEFQVSRGARPLVPGSRAVYGPWYDR